MIAMFLSDFAINKLCDLGETALWVLTVIAIWYFVTKD